MFLFRRFCARGRGSVAPSVESWRGRRKVVASPTVPLSHSTFPIVFPLDSEKSIEMMPVLCSNWKEKVVYSAAGPQPQILIENEKLKVLIAGLEPGQVIPPHPESLAVYHFLGGTGWMRVDGERFAVGPGATVITLAGSVRGIEAETQLAFLATRVA